MKKSFLILTALCAAPLCGAQNLEVVPMPAATAAAVGLPAQSADICAALALLPQNTEAYMAVGNLPGFLKLVGMNAEDAGEEAAVVESAAVAFGAGSADMLRQFAPLYRGLASADTISELAENWAEMAHERAAAVIAAQQQEQSKEEIDKAIEALAAWHTAPVYAVLTVREEGREMVAGLQQMILDELSEEEGVEAVENGEWKGIRVRIPAEEIEDMIDCEDLTALQKVKLEGALAKLSLQVMVTVRDRALVLAVCADASELALADTPATSVLTSGQAAFALAQSNPLVAAYMPASVCNACRTLNLQPLQSVAGFATGVFKTLGAGSAPAAASYQKAVTAVAALCEQMEKQSPEVDAPSTLLLWEDGDLHLDVVADANGSRFTPAEGIALPTSDKTFFIFDSDPVQGKTPCDAAALLSACETLTEGLAATLNEDASDMAQGAMAQYHLFDSEKEMLGSACTTWKNAFTGRVSMVADAAGSVPASLLGGSPAEMVTVPRVAIAAGVAERADIEKGRAIFMDALGKGMEKVGMEASMLDELPVAESKSGAATLYSLALPVCCPGFSPSVAVTDKTWSLSSSAELGSAMVGAAPVPAAAEGKATFCFTPAPVAELLAAAAAADTENEDLAEASEAAQMVASFISQISGTVTLSADDLMHLRVDVKLNH